MNKELEEDKKQINKMLNNIYDGLEFEDDEEIRELYLKQKHTLKTALNCIENSIPKEVIEKKREELLKLKQRNIKRNFDTVYKDGYFTGGADVLFELLEGK